MAGGPGGRARGDPRASAAHLRVRRPPPVRGDPRRGGAARLGRGGPGRGPLVPPRGRAVGGPRRRVRPVRGRDAGRGRRADLAHADAPRARGGSREPAGGGRAGGDERGRLAGGRPHALLPARPLQPDRLHDRRQRGRELRRRALLQVRLHHQLRDRAGAGAARRLAGTAGRQGARPARAGPPRGVRGLRGHARRGHEDLAARGARPRGGADPRGLLRLHHGGRRGGVRDRGRRASCRERSR